MDGNSLLKYGLIAGGGYLLYQYFSTPAAPHAAVAPATGGASAPASGAAPAAPAFNRLDAIFQQLKTAVGTQNLTGDGFNYSLNVLLQPLSMTAPDPVAVFGSVPGWHREELMTLANYWALMAPYLRTNLGLTGLGFFHGLGEYIATNNGEFYRRAF